MSDPLHTRLSGVADQVQPVDLLERSLRRSRRIGQQRVTAVAGAVAAVLVVGVGVAFTLGPRRSPQPTPAASISASAAPSATGSPTPAGTPSSAPPSSPTGAPVAGSLQGLPGWLYYRTDFQSGLERLDGGKLVPVMPATQGSFGTLSPDGSRIAAVTDAGNLIVTDRTGKNQRTLFTGVQGVGYEPAWSPDSSKILVGRLDATTRTTTMGTVAAASGKFTALPHALDGIHFLWSADGKHLAFATGTCQIEVTDADGGNQRQVPILGSSDTKVNPRVERSCDPFSLSPDGRLIALHLRKGSEDDGDIGPDYAANAIVDTTTGHPVALPVTGTLTAAVFEPDGSILTRTTHNATVTLTLLSPTLTIVTQLPEPAVVTSANLADYRPH